MKKTYDFYTEEELSELGIKKHVLGDKAFREDISQKPSILSKQFKKDFIKSQKYIGERLSQDVKKVISEDNIFIIILREGDLFFAGIKNQYKKSKIHKVGVRRVTFSEKELYYLDFKFESFKGKKVTVVDSVSQTGKTYKFVIDTFDLTSAAELNILCGITSVEFIRNITLEYPGINLYIGAVEKNLEFNNIILDNPDEEEKERQIILMGAKGYKYEYEKEEEGQRVLSFKRIY